MSVAGTDGIEFGNAHFKVSSGDVHQGLDIEGWITDTKGDSRCVYIQYNVFVSGPSHHPDKTIVRVCGKDDSDYGIKEQQFILSAKPYRVDMKLCREEGAFGAPDRDTCTKKTVTKAENGAWVESV